MNVFHPFKKGDVFIILLVVIAIAVVLLVNGLKAKSQNDELMAVITQDGKRVQELDLHKVQEFQSIKLPRGDIIVVAEKGRIRVLHSDCPDKICVNYGWLTRPGDQAICMPNKTVVTITEKE